MIPLPVKVSLIWTNTSGLRLVELLDELGRPIAAFGQRHPKRNRGRVGCGHIWRRRRDDYRLDAGRHGRCLLRQRRLLGDRRLGPAGRRSRGCAADDLLNRLDQRLVGFQGVQLMRLWPVPAGSARPAPPPWSRHPGASSSRSARPAICAPAARSGRRPGRLCRRPARRSSCRLRNDSQIQASCGCCVPLLMT